MGTKLYRNLTSAANITVRIEPAFVILSLSFFSSLRLIACRNRYSRWYDAIIRLFNAKEMASSKVEEEQVPLSPLTVNYNKPETVETYAFTLFD
jgi:hypothetical protein